VHTIQLGTLTPDYQVLYEGGSIVLKCYSLSVPEWFKRKHGINVTELRGNQNFQLRGRNSYGKLVVKNAFINDTASYHCKGLGAGGVQFEDYAVILVASSSKIKKF